MLLVILNNLLTATTTLFRTTNYHQGLYSGRQIIVEGLFLRDFWTANYYGRDGLKFFGDDGGG